jgi:uncharacterized protein YciI
MFIIDLHYLVPLSEIEKHVTDHRNFLDRYYAKNIFISSGPKEPRTGGIILASASSLEEIENIIKEDPFYMHQLASYTITRCIPNKGSLINR